MQKRISNVTYLKLNDEKIAFVVQQIRAGNTDARNKFVESNIGLVFHEAKKYLARGFSFQDLLGPGSLGLIRAAEKFNPNRGSFSAFALTAIKRSLRRFAREMENTIRFPEDFPLKRFQINTAIDKCKQQHGQEPNVDEISSLTGIPVEQVEQILFVNQPIVSLDQPVFADDIKKTSLIENTLDEAADFSGAYEQCDLLAHILTCLTKTDRQIIEEVYLNSKAVAEVANDLQVSVPAIRERIKRSLLKLCRKCQLLPKG